MASTVEVPASRADSGAPGAARHRWFSSYEPPDARTAPPSSFSAPSAAPNAVCAELCRMVDTLLCVAALLIALVIVSAPPTGALQAFVVARLTPRNVLLLAAFAFIWQEIFFLFGLDRLEPDTQILRLLPRVMLASAIGSVLALLLAPFSSTGMVTLRLTLLVWLLTVLTAMAARYVIRAIARPRNADPTRVLIVGSGPRAQQLHKDLAVRGAGAYEFVGFVDSTDSAAHPSVEPHLLGDLESLEKILMTHVVDEVLIALPIKSRYAQIQRAIEDCERNGVEAKYLADVFRCSLAGSRYEDSGRYPVVTVKVASDDARLLVKRVIDILGALVGLITLSPVLLAVAIAVRLTSDGPIVFAQERYGLRKRRFRMYKFRTMYRNAAALQAALEYRNEASGPVFKIKDDPRITPLGAFLRRTSLDELPQFVNVLKGDMSLVGPRPLPTRDVHLFREAWLMRRFSVLPGLTCLWQISGRSSLGFDDWIALDLQYIDHWSLGLDLAILAKTVPAVMLGRGAA